MSALEHFHRMGSSQPVQLSYRISSLLGGFQALNSERDFAILTSEPAVLDSINLEDDSSGSQLASFKCLDAALRCELYAGHCFVTPGNGPDSHRHLNHRDMSLWAKHMSLGKASIYSPSSSLKFDSNIKKHRGGGEPGGHQVSTTPDVYVTVQNFRHGDDHPSSLVASQAVVHTSNGASSSTVAGPSRTPSSSQSSGLTPQLERIFSWSPSPSPELSSFLLAPPSPPTPILNELSRISLDSLLQHLDLDQPGEYFSSFITSLNEAGINNVNALVLHSVDMISQIGSMGRYRALQLMLFAECYLKDADPQTGVLAQLQEVDFLQTDPDWAPLEEADSFEVKYEDIDDTEYYCEEDEQEEDEEDELTDDV
ncbi:hypothetical protein C8Q75DRAFT_811692 [Abortiporus biennis]|nr:hypothetical protein C8Q75DRAFT_811692 [Abortiporus biennis]